MNGFSFVPSARADKHTVTMNFSCPVVFRLTDGAPTLSRVVFETISSHTVVSYGGPEGSNTNKKEDTNFKKKTQIKNKET